MYLKHDEKSLFDSIETRKTDIWKMWYDEVLAFSLYHEMLCYFKIPFTKLKK